MADAIIKPYTNTACAESRHVARGEVAWSNQVRSAGGQADPDTTCLAGFPSGLTLRVGQKLAATHISQPRCVQLK